MGAGLPPRPSSVSRNLSFLSFPCIFVVLVPTSIIPAKIGEVKPRGPLGLCVPPLQIGPVAFVRLGETRMASLSGQSLRAPFLFRALRVESCARRRSQATIRIAALTIEIVQG